MCGIAGYWSFNDSIQNEQIDGMLKCIEHRGPDSQGVWVDIENRLFIGHVRLSIMDLSEAGLQPMTSHPDARYVVAFNGEIYNHAEIRQKINKIKNISWRGNSDTETIAVAFDIFGIDSTIEMLVGMFAIVVWDKLILEVRLIRDRAGEKPLYYGIINDVLIFGSELKSFKNHSAFEEDICYEYIPNYLHNNYNNSNNTIYKKVYSVPPASSIKFDAESVSSAIVPKSIKYWNLNQEKIFIGNYSEAKNLLLLKLEESIRIQSISDVPLGAFLSGGIDSSLLVAIYTKLFGSQIKTFSIGFADKDFDESNHARNVANFLKTNHVEMVIDYNDCIDAVIKIPKIWDEPFADSSQIPTYLLCKLAGEHVKVCLTGDGADELFMGYPKYGFLDILWKLRWFAKLCKINNNLAKICKTTNFFTNKKLISAIDMISKGSAESFINSWNDKYRISLNPYTKHLQLKEEFDSQDSNNYDFKKYLSLSDLNTYLVNDILIKVDRASMSNSIELRAPFLDHRLMEYAFSLPTNFKHNFISSKRILKDLAYEFIPRKILERPKQGFMIPLAKWLRGEMHATVFDSLKSLYLNYDFDKEIVINIWRNHQNGSEDNSEKIWGLYCLAVFLNNH